MECQVLLLGRLLALKRNAFHPRLAMFSRGFLLQATLLVVFEKTCSFQTVPTFTRAFVVRLQSSVGDGPPRDDDSMGGFLEQEDSENLYNAREIMSDQSLPISFDGGEDTDEDVLEEADLSDGESNDDETEGDETEETPETPEEDSMEADADGQLAQANDLFQSPSDETISSNPYLKVVSGLAPSDLISKFTSSAHPRVQNAVRTTILGIIGSLPKMAFETTTITTGARLASLMFQLQMTGYMFKNAEYRLSVSQMSSPSSSYLLAGAQDDGDDLEEKKKKDPLRGKIRGKLRLRFRRSKEKPVDEEATTEEKKGEEKTEDSNDIEMEVDADAYMSEIREEVASLRSSLAIKQQEKEDAIRKDLLLYIRTLQEEQLRSLTGTMSEDVLVAMKGLVNAVMAGIGEGQVGPETLTEQSGEAMAQLCMWQLVVGYNLRELEVREEMKSSLVSVKYEPDDGAAISEPGAFE